MHYDRSSKKFTFGSHTVRHKKAATQHNLLHYIRGQRRQRSACTYPNRLIRLGCQNCAYWNPYFFFISPVILNRHTHWSISSTEKVLESELSHCSFFPLPSTYPAALPNPPQNPPSPRISQQNEPGTLAEYQYQSGTFSRAFTQFDQSPFRNACEWKIYAPPSHSGWYICPI